MPLASVHVRNFRSIASAELTLAPITLLIGRNNSGKSSLLRALGQFQQPSAKFAPEDIRHGAADCSVESFLTPPLPTALLNTRPPIDQMVNPRLTFTADRVNRRVFLRWSANNQPAQSDFVISAQRPNHLIVPILARRKSMRYNTVSRLDMASEVTDTDDALTSRLLSLAGSHAEGAKYRELMQRVMEQEVATYMVEDGHMPGLPISTTQGIALNRMGEGVSSVVRILSELAEGGNRLFLIEEPENDLHPGALLNLLEVILAYADHSQFVISTHSDLVLRTLGSHEQALVYKVDLADDPAGGLRQSTYTPVETSFERLSALEDLGYEATVPFAWLVLEESSAQTFIEQCLIPLFAPELSALRVVASHGTGDVQRTFASLHRMILFAHLASNSRAWVLADGDDSGTKAVAKLRGAYRSWPETRFRTLDQPAIEAYYPARFASRVASILGGPNDRRAMQQKGELVEQVAQWVRQYPDEAKRELSESAHNIITELRSIAAQLAAFPA